MIAPPPAARSAGMARREQWNMLSTSIRSVASSSSGVTCSTSLVGPAMPALLTSTSRPFRCPIAASMKPSHSAATPASARMPACPQLASEASSTSETNTSAPQAAKLSAMTLPIPLAPAVMATRRPVRSTVSGVRAPWIICLFSC